MVSRPTDWVRVAEGVPSDALPGSFFIPVLCLSSADKRFRSVSFRWWSCPNVGVVCEEMIMPGTVHQPGLNQKKFHTS